MATQAIGTAQQALQGAFVEIGGARMHYVHAGEGRPIILIHGLVGSAANWRRNMEALAQERSVYAIDMVCMGKSDRVAGLDASLPATADRVAALMDALGLAQADIAGHSHGGAVALMFAARYPQRVRSLALFAPANPFSDLSDRLVRLYSSTLGRRLACLAPYLPRQLQLFFLGRMYGDPKRIAVGTLDGYTDGGRIPGTIDHVLAIVRDWFTDMASLRAALPQVAAPTLLVWGDCDRAVSLASGTKLHRELPGSELRVMSGCGHVVFEEMPEESNHTMRAWLQRSHNLSRPAVFAAPTQSIRDQQQPVIARTSVSATLQHLSSEAQSI